MAQLDQLGVAAPVILKSTVPPGTCAEIATRWPRVRLVFSPEFLRERDRFQIVERYPVDEPRRFCFCCLGVAISYFRQRRENDPGLIPNAAAAPDVVL